VDALVKRCGAENVAEYVLVFLNINLPRVWTNLHHELLVRVHVLLNIDKSLDIPDPCAYNNSDDISLCLKAYEVIKL
jgi:hypothetical protein